jgi:tellurite resistance protein TehA-like permease
MRHDLLLWLFVLLVGLFFLLLGVRAIREEHKRNAGKLSILMAICAFISCALEALVYELHITGSSRTIILNLELVVGGVWLGAFIILHVFGYVRLLTAKSKEGDKK